MRADKIRKLVNQLHSLEQELLSDTWYRQMQNEPGFRETMAGLKSAVDNVRTTIWCFTKADNAFECARLKVVVDRHRMQRTVELLRRQRQKQKDAILSPPPGNLVAMLSPDEFPGDSLSVQLG